MTERDITICRDEPHRTTQPGARTHLQEAVLSRSQGTKAVRGTWSSEGEAGRHHRPKAKPTGTPSPPLVQPRLDRIAEQARAYPEMAFTTLAHHLDAALLERAFWSLNPRSAAGMDRVTWRDYQRDLETNLEVLHGKLVSGAYVPQPVVRKWIPKQNGKLRPLGLPALEDKIVAKAVALLLEQIYEQDFCDFSYGFRPGRSCHQALRDLREGLIRNGIRCVIDCDISAFFDNLQHDELLAILRQRINDGRLLTLIRLWLEAGIMDGKELVFPEKGSPQGSVISPLLANVYLHEVLDQWFQDVVTSHCRGKVVMYRYADDFIIGCASEEDARRIMDVLPLRFGKYGLEINAEKTRLVRFARPPWGSRPRENGSKPETFTFLGFTHYWGKMRGGGYTVKRKTEGKRLRRTLSSLRQWCRANRHRPLEQQHRDLCAKLLGHYQYYGVRGNSECLRLVQSAAERAWRYWLSHRGGRRLTWQRFGSIRQRFPLPGPRITQPHV